MLKALKSSLVAKPSLVRGLSTKTPAKDLKIGIIGMIIGMGHVGNALIKNLQKQNFNVRSILDIDETKCQGFSCNTAPNPRDLVSAL